MLVHWCHHLVLLVLLLFDDATQLKDEQLDLRARQIESAGLIPHKVVRPRGNSEKRIKSQALTFSHIMETQYMPALTPADTCCHWCPYFRC